MKRLLLSLLAALLLCGVAARSAGASTGPVAVSVPNLTDGQTVGGKVTLSAIAAAPEPIVAMEYFVDEALLAKVVLAPFTYEWDTTQFPPGLHTLKVQATDRAGNTGEAQVTLNIVPPLALTLSAPGDVIPIGERIKLNVAIANLNELAQLDLIVDNQVLGSTQTPPFALELDTRQIAVGPHRVTVRATDRQGNQAHASLSLHFAAQNEDYNWAYPVLTLLLIAAALAAGVAVWRTVVAMRHSTQRTCRVLLQNLGNVPTRYELLVDDPGGALKFRLLLNNALLPQEPLVKATTRSAGAAPANTASPAHVREAGRGIANLAYTVGNVLPGSLGDNLKSWAMRGYEADRQVQNAEYARTQAQTLTKTSGIQSATRSTSSSSSAASAATATADNASVAVSPGAWYTPYFQPGDTASLSLVVKPSQPFQRQHYVFQLSSRAIDPVEKQAQTTTGNLLVEGASLSKYYVTFFVIAGITLIIVVAIGVLLANAGG